MKNSAKKLADVEVARIDAALTIPSLPVLTIRGQSQRGSSCVPHAPHLLRESCRILVERKMGRVFKPYHVRVRRIDLGKILFCKRIWIAVIIATGKEIDGSLHSGDDIHQFA